jgi:hypothetical protein
MEVSYVAQGKPKPLCRTGLGAVIATTERKNFYVGASSFTNNPFNGNTQAQQIKQGAILMEGVSLVPKTVCIDNRYWLRKEEHMYIQTLLQDMRGQMTDEGRKHVSGAPSN